MSLKSTLVNILSSSNTPMTPNEIWNIMQIKELNVINSKTPINSIVGFFSKDVHSKKPTFKRTKKNLYELRKKIKITENRVNDITNQHTNESIVPNIITPINQSMINEIIINTPISTTIDTSLNNVILTTNHPVINEQPTHLEESLQINHTDTQINTSKDNTIANTIQTDIIQTECVIPISDNLVTAENSNVVSEITIQSDSKLPLPQHHTHKKQPTEYEKRLYECYVKKIMYYHGRLDHLCFVCGKGGDLIFCFVEECTRVYHSHCVQKITEHSVWYCPLHFCGTCGTYPTVIGSTCSMCGRAFCKKHLYTIDKTTKTMICKICKIKI